MPHRPIFGVAKRIASFSVTVGVSTVLGIVSIPVLTGSLGAETWASVALVQLVAQLCGTFVAFGWGATGPSTIAAASADERPSIFAESLVARSYLYVIGVAVATVVLTLLTRGDLPLALVGSATYLLPSLGAAWYFVGEARPWRLFFFDSLPVMLGTLGGIISAAVTHSVFAFLALQALGNCFEVALAAFVVLRTRASDRPRPPLSLAHVARSLSGQRHAVTSALTAGFYVSVPSIAVQIFMPSMLPTYVMADRFFRYASIAFSPVQQFFQGWIPESGAASMRRRMPASVLTAVGAGAVGGALIAAFAPLVGSWLSHGQIYVPFSLSVPLGIAFLGVAISAVVGYACLVLVDRARALAASTLLGGAVGVPLIVLAAIFGWLSGVGWAVAVLELTVAVYQLFALRRAFRDGAGSIAPAGAPDSPMSPTSTT